MTQKSNYLEQGRAIFLAAIMVLSVVAMSATLAGSAAAQELDDRSPEDVTVNPGETVDITIEYSSNQQNIEVYSEEIVSGSGIATITDATSDAAQGVPSDDGNSAQALYISPVDSDTFTVTVEVAESASDGDTIELSGTIVDSDGGETDTGTTTITVEEEVDDGPEASTTINDQSGQSPVESIDVASANASVDYVVAVHQAGGGSPGDIVGVSEVFTAGQEQTNFDVDVTESPVSGFGFTESQTIYSMVHRANSSEPNNLGNAISGSTGFVNSAQLTVTDQPDQPDSDGVEPADVSVLFQGEEVSVDVTDEASDGDILQIVEGVIGTDDTERVASVQAEEDADGNLIATFQQENTEDLATDAFHFFRIGSQDLDGTQFEVLGQELDVSFDSNVTTESTVGTLSVASDNYADNVDADSFRSDTFTLEVNSDGLNNEELADVFDVSEDSAVDDPEADDPVQVAGVAPGDDLRPDFDGIAEGDYEFDVSVVETTASDDAVVAVEPPRDEEAALGENTVRENVGDIADIPVEFVDTDTATVDISIDGYSAEIEVTDDDDDGDVTLQYNTALAGNNNGDAVVSTADSDDSATLINEEAIDQRLPVDSYTVEVRLGDARQDRGQLVLTERSTDLVQVHVAPESVPGPTEGDDGTEFLEEAGTNVLGEIGLSTVAEGDTVAVLIGASGIEGDHDDFTGEAGISLELVEQNTDQFEDADVLNASTNPAVFGDVAEREAIDGTEDQYLVEIDTSALASADNGGLQAYDVEFTVSEDSPYVDESDQGEDSNAEQVTSEFELDESSVSLIDPDDDDTYTLTNTGNVSISGGSNLAPGTGLTVSVVGDASFQSTSATTDASGDFEATFDLSGVDSDQSVDVEVDSGLTGTVTFDAEFGDTQETDLVTDADRIPGLEATISDLEDQLADREATISDLESQLEEADSTISDLESQLEEADSTISDLESQLEEADSTISDLESQLEERNSTISDLETEVSDLESQLEDAQNESGGDSDGGGPGFGIAAALVALIGAALLAVRRRD